MSSGKCPKTVSVDIDRYVVISDNNYNTVRDDNINLSMCSAYRMNYMDENIEAQRAHLSGLLKVTQLNNDAHPYSCESSCVPGALHILLIFHKTER